MSYLIVCNFLGALILGPLIYNGFRANGLGDFFTDCTSDCVRLQVLLTYGLFICGGFVSSMMNYIEGWPLVGKQRYPVKVCKDYDLTFHSFVNFLLASSIILWMVGNIVVGSNYTQSQMSYFQSEATSDVILESVTKGNVVISAALVSFFGGYFYWGVLGQSLMQIKSKPTKLTFMLSVMAASMPIYAMILNLCFLHLVSPKGGFFYTYRLVALLAVPLFVFQIVSFQDFDQDQSNTKKLKSSQWRLVSLFFEVGLFQCFYILPFFTMYTTIDSIHATEDQQNVLLNLLFGGLLVGKLGAAMLASRVQTKDCTGLRLFMELGASLSVCIIFTCWSSTHTMPAFLALAFFYATFAGFTDSWHTFQIATSVSDINPRAWMWVYGVACVPGPFIAWVYVNSNWKTDVPLPVMSISWVLYGLVLIRAFFEYRS